MLIKANARDKIDVNIRVRNSRDSAYNTKVNISFTPNINYVKVEVGFLLPFILSHFSGHTAELNNRMFYSFFISQRRIAL